LSAIRLRGTEEPNNTQQQGMCLVVHAISIP
jgi:hypothetical protein